MSEIAGKELYINRELSWLAFNRRVLDQARDTSLPIFERLKFLGIYTSNLDEFFMVRVAGLKQQIAGGVKEAPADGLVPTEQWLAVSREAHAQVAELYAVWNTQVRPALEEVGCRIVRGPDLTSEQYAAAEAAFQEVVFPTLTPLAVDAGHPFPHLRNKSLNLALLLKKCNAKGKKGAAERLLAVVQVPQLISRLIPLPSPEKGRSFTLLGDVISLFAAQLFPGYEPTESAMFRVTRNWDLSLDEDESEDLLSTVQEELHRRDRGAAVRLELVKGASETIRQEICSSLNLTAEDVYVCDGPLQLYDLNMLAENETRPELFFPPFTPIVPKVFRQHDSVFEALQKGDILLHHPYDSFEPVVRFIEEAAEDPDVIAIKQTFYRTSGDSPFIQALLKAAENGKQVTAFVEIKARFDEAANINWAKELEENGVHIAYGLVGLKTHAKTAMVVRREGSSIRRYVHLGTGNYNPNTARYYTDISLMTTRRELAEDVTALFNSLTGYAETPAWKRLSCAPKGLHQRTVELIQQEAQKAKAGKPCRIIAKMNSLVDPVCINALYKASQAGVPITLIVRGICCLRPGIPGISDTIRVVSVVDRFLEHSRLFSFGVGEEMTMFASSADWMPRNFLRRIEAMFPIEDPVHKARCLEEILALPLLDNVKASVLLPDGRYVPNEDGRPPFRSQMQFIEVARGRYHPPVEEPETEAVAEATEQPEPSPNTTEPGSAEQGGPIRRYKRAAR